MPGPVDPAHAPLAQLVENLVIANDARRSRGFFICKFVWLGEQAFHQLRSHRGKAIELIGQIALLSKSFGRFIGMGPR